MIFCKELNKSFDTKDQMFIELKANKDKIIKLKKASIKHSDPFVATYKELNATKEESETSTIKVGDFIYPVINSCYFFDSHGDVHITGLWDVSARDQKGKIHYIINHELEIGKVIAYPNDVEPFVTTVAWKDLGYDYQGSTQVLVFKALLSEASNEDFKKAAIQGVPLQNSIRMQYISMTLCVDSDNDDFKQERENFYKYLPDIANKQDVLDEGYYWAITEAKIYLEGSAVLRGSNPITPLLTSDPSNQDSQKDEKDPTIVSPPIHVKTKSFINLI